MPLSRYFLGPLYEGRLPNALTFARVCAIPVLAVAFLVPSLTWLTTLLLALTSFTDWLDGYLARKWKVPPPPPPPPPPRHPRACARAAHDAPHTGASHRGLAGACVRSCPGAVTSRQRPLGTAVRGSPSAGWPPMTSDDLR